MIDENIQLNLRKKYNPDGSELRTKQLALLEMLKYIDKVCKEQKIKYWLASGSCLGAIRHGGFIPWDDDIDIELLEEDYNKLIAYLQTHPTDNYILQTHKNDENYLMDFVKLRDRKTKVKEILGFDINYKYSGLFIDIFKLSPSNSKFLHYICARLRILELYCKLWSNRNGGVKCIFSVLRSFDNFLIKICKYLDRIGAKGQLRHSLGIPFLKPRFKSDVDNITHVLFEGYLFPVPANYDAYLRNLYGEYHVIVNDHSHF